VVACHSRHLRVWRRLRPTVGSSGKEGGPLTSRNDPARLSHWDKTQQGRLGSEEGGLLTYRNHLSQWDKTRDNR
jgi:hypothetical protein